MTVRLKDLPRKSWERATVSLQRLEGIAKDGCKVIHCRCIKRRVGRALHTFDTAFHQLEGVEKMDADSICQIAQ